MVGITGATGTGKSTCVPLFLLRDAWRSNSQIRIIVTQPRRVAAVSLAQRVASFLPPGYNEVGQVVGYRVGGNREDAGARGRKQSILFTTTAYLRSLLVHAPFFFDEVPTHIYLQNMASIQPRTSACEIDSRLQDIKIARLKRLQDSEL